MPYSLEKKGEALELLNQEVAGHRMSIRAVARTVGVSSQTVANWAKAEGIDTSTTDVTKPPDPKLLAELLVKKARKLMAGIERLDPKAAMETATAVEKLTNSYLKLAGLGTGENPVAASQVNVIIQDLLRPDPDEG